jgi:predicted unusual protein kinase regulating ubiquinone biosynthesis (AarF/ABC1/UbiB family)
MLRNRYRRILLFFIGVLFSLFYWHILLPRLGFGRLTDRTHRARFQRHANDYRDLAVHMGGVLIKIGQFMSARVDVLPAEITDALSDLQDEVPSETYDRIRRVAEADLGIPLDVKFSVFEKIPLAAASLGQVHRASVDGQDVVVKILRPDIERIVATDMAALHTVGRWLMLYAPIGKRANIPALLDEFERVTKQELDYNHEGKNAEIFAENFKNRPGVRVPRVIWSHTTQRVLTLENVLSIKITDYDAITRAGIDRAEVAQRLFNTYLQQFFEDGFFHADPHPGNLFVDPLPEDINGKKAWMLTFVDFGMTGRVPDGAHAAIREFIIAMGTRDSARLVKSYQMLGMLLPGADLTQLEQVETALFDRFWGKTMQELRETPPEQLQEFVRQYRDVLYQMPFQVPQDLIFMGRAIAILSGICTGLDPSFNVWESLVPYARKLLVDEGKGGFNLDVWMNEIGSILTALVSVPKQMDNVLRQLQRGEVAVRTPLLEEQVSALVTAIRHLGGAIIFFALLSGSVQLYLAEKEILAGGLAVSAVIALIWMLSRRD